jgi:hypothetical protein
MGLDKNMLGAGGIFRNFTKYPRCKIFNCSRSRAVSYKCCYYCEKKGMCHDPCKNDPQKCGQCYYPEIKEGETPMWELWDMNLPDAPIIRNTERFGAEDPSLIDDGDREITCPICGKLAETFYYDCDGTLFGCDRCVTKKDAEDYQGGGME